GADAGAYRDWTGAGQRTLRRLRFAVLGVRLRITTHHLRHLYSLQVRTVKISIDGLHKACESRIRLGIMSALAVNETLDFNSLKTYLDLTDGNLASHLKALEKETFIGVKKTFVARR